MPLPSLFSDVNSPTDVQKTTLGLDVVSRFVCSTWDEATADPGGIDVVILGGGLFGGYCASKIYELSRERFGRPDTDAGDYALRVLVLDAGPFVVSEHTQNYPDLGLYDPGIFNPFDVSSGHDPGPRNQVWGVGWRSNKRFAAQAYCVGGKGLFWGGWCPRLQEPDLMEWPEEVRDYLTTVDPVQPVGFRPIEHEDPVTKQPLKRGDALTGYETLEYEIGVRPSDDFVFDPVQVVKEGDKAQVGLNESLLHFIADFQQQPEGAGRVSEVVPAPIAVQTQSFIAGLFALDKYSSLPALMSSIRRDRQRDEKTTRQVPRISVVPYAHVVRLECEPSEQSPIGTRQVSRILVNVGGTRKVLEIGSHCQVVLAMSCIESTRLALESFSLEASGLVPPGGELMGRNFMMHLRADVAFKVERARFASFVADKWPDKRLADLLQLGSLHVQCDGAHGRYQYQLYAATSSNGPDAGMYRMVPDLDIQRTIAKSFDDWSISFVLRASGEVKGGRKVPLRSGDFPYVDLAGSADDDALSQHRRAWVQFNRDHSRDEIWQDIHDTAHALARYLAHGGKLEYVPVQHTDAPGRDPYSTNDFTLDSLSRQQLEGSTFHDAGTLWMGDDPATSVTDATGHFHHMTNVYCSDQALFPTVGSANPALTGLCLSRRVAEDIVKRHDSHVTSPAELAGFRDVPFDGRWINAPYEGAALVGNGILEMQPDQKIGFHYLPEIHGDFDLHVEWKAFRSPAAPNSGVLLRMPDPAGVNFDDQEQFDAFYAATVEVQIDDQGKNFVRGRSPQAIFGDSHYKTGAVYGVAPATRWAAAVWAPDDNFSGERYWNTYLISVRGNHVTVTLNGHLVCSADLPAGKRADGFIGFQFHTGRVRFRNLKIKA